VVTRLVVASMLPSAAWVHASTGHQQPPWCVHSGMRRPPLMFNFAVSASLDASSMDGPSLLCARHRWHPQPREGGLLLRLIGAAWQSPPCAAPPRAWWRRPGRALRRASSLTLACSGQPEPPAAPRLLLGEALAVRLCRASFYLVGGSLVKPVALHRAYFLLIGGGLWRAPYTPPPHRSSAVAWWRALCVPPPPRSSSVA
jgi:hypothetical protein